MTPAKTAADYAAVAVAPLLIFLMISSLANFLMMILYHGGFPQRVSWTLMMYTLGAVGVARVAIEQTRAYSYGYAGVLGIATFTVMLGLVDSPIFSLFILVVIAYLADVIVRDCTLIDDTVDASGRGLMDSGQLFVRQRIQQRDVGADGIDPPSSGRRVHQPGRTVMYLALAALPLFGLGQFFLRNDPEVWARAQKLLAFYLFSSLSLLVTTSFLGLRRYLRQRHVEMPTDVSISWLGGGLALVAAVLMVAYIAPMPGKALASIEVPSLLDSPGNTRASRFGWGDEGADQSDPDAPATTGDPNAANKEVQGMSPQQGAPPGEVGSGNRDDGPAGNQSGGKQKSGGSGGNGDSQRSESQSQSQKSSGEQSRGQQQSNSGNSPQDSQQPSPKQSSSQQQADSNSGKSPGDSSSNQQGSRDGDGSESGDTGKQGDAAKSQQSQSESTDSQNSDQGDASSQQRRQDDAGDADGERSQGETGDEPSPGEQSGESASPDTTSEGGLPPEAASQSSPPSSSSSRGILESIADAVPMAVRLVKYAVYLVLFGIVAAFLWLHRHMIMEFWNNLFGRSSQTSDESMDEFLSSVTHVPPRAFASFKNPIGKENDIRRIIVITFQAFEAWTRENVTARGRDETPSEFMRRVAAAVPQMSAPASQVVEAYNRIVYGRGKATRNDLNAAEQVWNLMRSGAAAASGRSRWR